MDGALAGGHHCHRFVISFISFPFCFLDMFLLLLYHLKEYYIGVVATIAQRKLVPIIVCSCVDVFSQMDLDMRD
jgi:hypothetical protein